MRLVILVITCFVIATALYYGAIAIFTLTQYLYPLGTLYYLPWGLGLCGLLGLISAARNPACKSVGWYQAEIILLSAGLGAAAIFLLLSLFLLASLNLLSSPGALAFYATVLSLCLLLPSLVAVAEIRRAVLELRRSVPIEKVSLYRVLLITAAVICAPVCVRLVGQEAIMLWYGRDLAAAATASAERIAAGKPYCVLDFNGAQNFEALDKRQILLAAIENHYGFGFNHLTKPHFGVSIDGDRYWWSFRQREFTQLPITWNLPRTACD